MFDLNMPYRHDFVQIFFAAMRDFPDMAGETLR